jgi:hydroxypyruvate isomerase
MTFDLAVCAEMVFVDLPFEQRVRRIAELGFAVEMWTSTPLSPPGPGSPR